MRALGIAAFVLLLLIGGCMAGYKLAFPTYIYRYRMTVEVAVGSKLHSGSSVIEVSVTKQPHGFPELRKVRGEAVYVDIGHGRNVIALLASGPNAQDVNYPSYIAQLVLGLTTGDEIARFSKSRGSQEVPSGRLPTFVTFSDIGDPKIARVVQPHEFPKIFGLDVHLKDVRIEMTDDLVTRKIQNEIPKIIEKLREKARTMQVAKFGAPYASQLGDFYIGD